MPSTWMIRAGEEAAHFEEFETGGYAGIGWKEIGEVPADVDPDELERRLAAAYPDYKPGAFSNWSAQIRRFLTELAIGDGVVTYDRKNQTYLVGEITAPVEWRPDLPLPRVYPVRWAHRVPRNELSESTRKTLGAIQTLFRLNEPAAHELRQKGEMISTPENRARIAKEFWNACLEMLEAYPHRPPALSADSEPVQIRRRIQTSLAALASVLLPNPNWRSAASVGQGNWAATPWSAVFDSRVTTSAQKGTYPVIHFLSDAGQLRLGWGVSWTEYGPEGQQQRANEVARTLTESELSALQSRSFHIVQHSDMPTIPEHATESGMVVWKMVPRSVLEAATDELTEDFATLLECYRAWVDRTSTPAPAEPPAAPATSTPPTREYTIDWLANETQLNTEFLQDLVDALTTRTPQIILAGPPGTSKTWVAQKLAEYLTQGAADRQNLLQFHPSYSYEEFVEGLRPTAVGGAIQFEPVKGHLLRVVGNMDDTPARHVMVLDEINRANLPRVLGELLYLLEYRDRPLDLQYSKNFRLPARLLFIGTMNTADRSIRTLDAAIRRRFEVFECMPDPDLLRAYYQSRSNSVPDLTDGFTALNAALTSRLDRHHAVGHAFFMVDEMTPQRLLKTWRYKVGPLIEEYFFDQPDVVAEFTPAKFWGSVADLS